MAGAAAHVVLLLAVSADPSAAAVSRAAADAIAAPFTEPPRVIVRTLPASPPPATLAALARDTHADAVVVLTCTGTGCATADVRLANDGAEPAKRSVRFGAGDDLGERGRAIGLLASTLLPDDWNRSSPAGGTVPASPAAVTSSIAIATGPPAQAAYWAADAMGSFLTPTSGGSAFGFTVAASRAMSGGWAVRGGLKVEVGDLPGDAGTVRSVGGIAGVTWTSPGLTQPHHFGWGARADFVAFARKVRPAVDLDGDNIRTDLALGGDAVALVGFALSERTALLASAGAEILGSVDGWGGRDDDSFVWNPPAFRLVGELGILARF